LSEKKFKKHKNMSGLENLTLDNLGVSFLDLDTFEKENENGIEFGDTVGVFGPSKAQLKSYAGWENTDGKFYLPYNKRQNIGKISDFVSAAIMANIMEEREKEKNEMQKKVELEKKEAKLKAKIAKYSKYDEGGKGSLAAEEGEALEDDDGFVTIEDKETKARNTNQKSWTHNNQQQNWRGRGGWNNRGGRGGAYT
jgi:DNA-binding protein H-NS